MLKLIAFDDGVFTNMLIIPNLSYRLRFLQKEFPKTWSISVIKRQGRESDFLQHTKGFSSWNYALNL